MTRPSIPLLTLLLIGSLAVPVTTATAAPALTGLDVSSGNRRSPVSGLYDWSKAGYRGNGVLPGNNELNPDANCQITSTELASQFNVRPNDTADDSAGLQAAIDDGVPVLGYLHWTLMDNFEWAEGYGQRWGIVYVDFKTQRRYPKRSALWYRDVIRRNGLDDLPGDIR